LIGGGIEIFGLAVAAYGLFLTWRGVAEGHPLIPRRRNRHFSGTASLELPAVTGNAYGYVTVPSESIDEKLARVHTVLETLDQRIAAEERNREDAIRQLRSTVGAERSQDDASRKAEARSDTRLAVAGLSFAAVGAVLQLVGAVS
jgi:hypothetical protein